MQAPTGPITHVRGRLLLVVLRPQLDALQVHGLADFQVGLAIQVGGLQVQWSSEKSSVSCPRELKLQVGS